MKKRFSVLFFIIAMAATAFIGCDRPTGGGSDTWTAIDETNKNYIEGKWEYKGRWETYKCKDEETLDFTLSPEYKGTMTVVFTFDDEDAYKTAAETKSAFSALSLCSKKDENAKTMSGTTDISEENLSRLYINDKKNKLLMPMVMAYGEEEIEKIFIKK